MIYKVIGSTMISYLAALVYSTILLTYILDRAVDMIPVIPYLGMLSIAFTGHFYYMTMGLILGINIYLLPPKSLRKIKGEDIDYMIVILMTITALILFYYQKYSNVFP